LVVRKSSYALPPSHHLDFVKLSLPPARVHTGGNQKKSGLEYRLGGQEVSGSVFEGWLLYGQQFGIMHCHIIE
jgi:hypothetical protein